MKEPKTAHDCEQCGEHFSTCACETVDLIASGYEWTCPNCDKLNHEIEVTEKVTCRKTWAELDSAPASLHDALPEGCGKTYDTETPEHAYS